MSFWTWLKGPDINKGVAECREMAGAVLIDVRSPQEYRMGHIPGSRNVPLETVARWTAEKDTPVYVYCQSGGRSRRAAKILRKNGFTNVTDLGGIVYWTGKRE